MHRIVPLLIGALVLSGCSWLFRERIPDFPTARQQYEYATALFEVTEPLPPERDRGPWNNQENNPYNDALTPRYRERDYRNFIHAFEKVPERFPTDTDFRPLAMIRENTHRRSPITAASSANSPTTISSRRQVSSGWVG
jgi:hypothetical protein